jgi:hypothetical protein
VVKVVDEAGPLVMVGAASPALADAEPAPELELAAKTKAPPATTLALTAAKLNASFPVVTASAIANVPVFL